MQRRGLSLAQEAVDCTGGRWREPEMEPEYDCQQCGACCVDYFGTEGYIWLTRGEADGMRRRGLPVVLWHGQVLLGTRPHDGPGGERCCVAFTGAVGGACS